VVALQQQDTIAAAAAAMNIYLYAITKYI